MIKNKLDTLHFISKAGICKRNSLNKEWLGYMTIITYYFMEFGYCGLGFFLWRLKALSWHRWYTSPMRTWVIREIHDKQIKSWFAFLVLKSTLPEATGKFKRSIYFRFNGYSIFQTRRIYLENSDYFVAPLSSRQLDTVKVDSIG